VKGGEDWREKGGWDEREHLSVEGDGKMGKQGSIEEEGYRVYLYFISVIIYS